MRIPGLIRSFSVSLVITSAASAQITWRGGVEELPRKNPAQIKTELTRIVSSQTTHFLLQLDQPLTVEVRQKLAVSGVTLLNYLGNNAFFASMDKGRLDAQQISNVPGLSRLAEVAAERKMHKDLNQGIIRDWTIIPQNLAKEQAVAMGEKFTHDDQAGKNPIVAVYAKFHPDVTLNPDATRLAGAHGAWVISELYTINALVLELPYENIRALVAEDAVEWVEPALPKMTENNPRCRMRTGADYVQAAPYNLDGAGITAMVYDGGIVRTTHVDFQGRAIIGSSEIACTPVIGHATHVAGTLGGAGVAVADNKGMAPGVEIVSYGINTGGQCDLSEGFLYTDPGDLETDYNNAINIHGADIANNSIGTNTATNGFPCSMEGDYGVTDTVIDSIVRGSLGAPFRVVWANGNERQVSTCDDPNIAVPAGYHKTAPPACAKNHITVGAVYANDDVMTWFSSWGPADDGRMKPDISAPGCRSNGEGEGVVSCGSFSDTDYAQFCGTSMACPSTCGCAALLLQDYRAQFSGSPDFRNSTLKILLSHTAVDLGNVGPDYKFGYGSIRIQPAIDFMRSGKFLEQTVSGTGDSFDAIAVIGPSDTQLKVTLAWDDPPGTPNVTRALVNDLDLRVLASNNQYYPWTLGGLANAAAPAVRTVRNSLDNIEQVVVDAPSPGVYLVQVYGQDVPQGPQPFSLCWSPAMQKCSSKGSVFLNRREYDCSSELLIHLQDCDLNTSNSLIESTQIIVASSTEPAGEIVTLTETRADSSHFSGSVAMGLDNSGGVLQISDGDTISATYADADDGMGGINVLASSSATIDCTVPVISGTTVSNVYLHGATITVTTSELTDCTIEYGTNCGSLTLSANDWGFGAAHSFNLSALAFSTTYFFKVMVRDEAGNSTTDDNGGACLTFTTPDPPELYTEIFSEADNDLDYRSITFVPNGSNDYYSSCGDAAFTLPIDPSGGTSVSLGPNASTQIILSENLLLYGVSYSRVYIGSNGYLTFTSGDFDPTETLEDHFNRPRVSALFDKLNPNLGGTISYKSMADRFVVTWLDIPDNGIATNSNTFQVEMFLDGRIRMTWLDISSTGGLVGLSGSTSLPGDFFESDFSAFGSCGPQPPTASDSLLDVPPGSPTLASLVATDDNQPGPLHYIIQSLPNHTIRDAGNNMLITSVPYTLFDDGHEVIFDPGPAFFGNDSFTFKVNDGGLFPTGGDSNTARVTLRVLPHMTLPFLDEFPNSTFDPNKWYQVSNATIETVGLNPPSPSRSALFNGLPVANGDSIISHSFDFSSECAVRLTYYWEPGGFGHATHPGKDLFVEFSDANGDWQILQQHPGSLPAASTFTLTTMLLPQAALHSSFRLRIRSDSYYNSDDWSVDRLSLVSGGAQATDVGAMAGFNIPVNIQLVGSSECDSVNYVITSLPSVGSLRDPGAGTITSVPYALHSNMVKFVPGPGGVATNTSFNFKVTDGHHDSNIATVSIAIGLQTIFSFPLNTDPLWMTTGQWTWGHPTGGGTHNKDPQAGFTGSCVYGYNLAGDYPNNMAQTEYLTTPVLNCTGVNDVKLRFRRWLGVQLATLDHASIDVSNNGATWTNVFNHTTDTISESSWSLQTYNIGATADNQPVVFVRWGMGPTDGFLTFPGWNIDDVEILGIVPVQCSSVLRGDVNNDGLINGKDVASFAQTLVNPAGASQYQLCASDLTANSVIDDADTAEFVNVLLFP
jgi:hypothetical protein